MNTYVLYIRTESNAILRHGHITFSWPDLFEPYVHEECLEGWPETKVFWRHDSGASVGLAPVMS